jgi:hypothetical protein
VQAGYKYPIDFVLAWPIYDLKIALNTANVTVMWGIVANGNYVCPGMWERQAKGFIVRIGNNGNVTVFQTKERMTIPENFHKRFDRFPERQ